MANNTPAPLLVDERTAAKMLDISPRTLWGLAASGAIPSIKIGRLKKYAVADLQEWVERQKKGGITS